MTTDDTRAEFDFEAWLKWWDEVAVTTDATNMQVALMVMFGQMRDAAARRDPEPVASADAASYETFIEAWYELLGQVDDAIVRGGWTADEVGTEEVFDQHRHHIEAAIRGEPVASADAAWEAFMENLVDEAVDEMPRIPDIAAIVDRHRPAIEAAIRGTEAVDVERLARAIEVGCRGGYVPELPLDIVARVAAAEYARLASADSEPVASADAAWRRALSRMAVGDPEWPVWEVERLIEAAIRGTEAADG